MTSRRSPHALLRTGDLFACNRGNVAMIFALALVPLSVVTGAGIDVTRAVTARSAAQNALDAAVLAAARANLDDEDELKAVFEASFEANASQIGLGGEFETDLEVGEDGELLGTLQGSIPAIFGGLIGMDTLPVKASAAAVRGSADAVEVALVLDNTWSMSANDSLGTPKINGLKIAAKALVEELMVGDDHGIRISVVPYADYINVGMGNRTASWLNVPDDYSVTSTPPPKTCWDEEVKIKTCTGGVLGTCTSWTDGVPTSYTCWIVPQTCVWTSKTPPEYVTKCSGGGPPVTTWYKWFGCIGSRNTGTLRLNDTQPDVKYPGFLATSQRCLNPILPLTGDRATVVSSINNLIVNIGGYKPSTYIPAGMVWGVNALSPTAPLTEGLDYGDQVRKIIVLMTDGENTMRYIASNGTHAATSVASQLAETNSDVLSICTYAKNQGMEIYTVSLGVTSPTALSMLTSCATSPGHAFAATDSTALLAAFRQIAESLRQVRLTR